MLLERDIESNTQTEETDRKLKIDVKKEQEKAKKLLMILELLNYGESDEDNGE